MMRHCVKNRGAQQSTRIARSTFSHAPRCQRLALQTITTRCSSSTDTSTHNSITTTNTETSAPSQSRSAATDSTHAMPATPLVITLAASVKMPSTTAAAISSTEGKPAPTTPPISRPVPDALTEQATAQLTELGCNPKQVAKIISTLATTEHVFDILEARQWLQLLADNNIRDPLPVLINNPLLLLTKARDLRENAREVGSWIFSMGLTSAEIVLTVSTYPTLLCTPHTANTSVVSQWLIRELGWDGRQIVKALAKFPGLFTYNTSTWLSPTLAWFKSNGFSIAAISKAGLDSPDLFGSSTEHLESQLAALQSLGLTHGQVNAMVLREPDLLTMTSLSGDVMKLKVKFFVEVMGRKVEDLVTCPAMLLRSLKGCIGPRWAFSTRYESHDGFQLGARLRGSDRQFAEAGRSKQLDAVCKARKQTRTQLYAKFKINWQKGDGSMWCGGVKEGGGMAIADAEHEGDSHADE